MNTAAFALRKHRVKLASQILGIILVTVIQAAAQPQVLATRAARNAIMNDARAAFKSGNPNIGLAKLQPAVSRAANAPHEDLQVARLLFTLACGFRNQRDTQALGQASGLALAKITNAEVKMNSADTTASYILAGELHDIIGNRAQAIAAYQQALSRNTNLGAARARLQQLIAIDANARERDAANALLRQRAATRR